MASTQATPDDYVLDRSYAAALRLNYQHKLWKDTLGFLIHPDIPIPRDDAQVADLATGTGIWMIEMACTLPSTVQFEAIDIDLSQCPPSEWLPNNCSVREWSIFEPVPDDMIGKYDIVHIALLGFVIKDDDATPIVERVHKLLKPGGWLQWHEYDDDNARVKAVKEVETGKLEELCSFLKVLERSWRRGLPTTLSKNGFENAALHTYETKPHLAKFWHDCFMTVLDELLKKKLWDPERTAEIQSLMNAAQQEARKGAALVFPQLVVVAQKIGNWKGVS